MGNIKMFDTVSYAIVESPCSGSGLERFIIAYRTEQSLHEFLVASSIVGSGYRSREEAARSCEIAALPMAA